MKKIKKFVWDWSYSQMFKFLRIMKLTVFLIFLSILSSFANNSFSQYKKYTLNFNESRVENVLKTIEEQSEFYFFLYSEKVIDVDRKVTVHVKDQNIESVLNQVFAGTNVAYAIKGRVIVLSTPEIIDNTIKAVWQLSKIAGTVTNKKGEPLPGVTVVLKGTNKGTVTDKNGQYTLKDIPSDGVLVFSFVGMQTQEIYVNNQSTINVTMVLDAIGIEEVVAVGYGALKKVNLTGAISNIEFDETVDNRPITNASQALGGNISGIWVSQNSGKPGADEAQLRIRGWGTLNNSNSLVIIDGVEGSFDQLNPHDVKSISVLKDAASAAIYGSKAANGVILITTKTGKTNQKLQVNLSSYVGVQELGMKYKIINNSAEHMLLWNKVLEDNGSSPVFSEDMIESFTNGTDKYKYPSTDWFKELFDQSLIHEHNISIRGGSENTSSFLSFNYLNQEGMVPNTASQRYGLRANSDLQVNNWFKIGGRINYIRRNSNEPYADRLYGSLGRVFEMLSGAPPYIAPYDRQGRFDSVEAIDRDGNLLFDNRNPLIDAANGARTTESNHIVINANADIQITKDLLIKTTFASTGNQEMIEMYNESVYGYTDSGLQTMTKNFNREGLEISRNQVSTMNNNLYSTLNYNKILSDIHNISVIAGLQLEALTIKNVYARRTEPPREGLTQVDAGTTGVLGDGNLRGYRMFSYFGRINYIIAEKYLFEANFRADASSRFREGNRWGVFPGFSAGWRLSEEKFIKGLDVLSNLKLRASWEQLGNQNISGYWPYVALISQNNNLSYSYGGTLYPGASVSSIVNKNITWETTTTLDIGFDLGLFNNRLNMVGDYFRKNTSGIIVQLPIPKLLGGLSAPYENVGEMLNTGFELTLNYRNLNLSPNQFGYNIGASFTYVENEVTKFRGGDAPDQLYLIREGYSYKSLYGYKVVGIYQTDEEASTHMHSNGFIPSAGNLKFEDLNDDGKLGYEDKQDIGNTIPKFTYGINTEVNYRGFNLSLLFQGIGEVHAYTQNNFTTLSWENRATSVKWKEAWTPENPDTKVPSLKFDDSWDMLESSYWVQDITFIKLKNIQLGYNFPESFVSNMKFEKIYLYINAQNVYTLVGKDYEGYDPERSTFNSGNRMYPVPRIYSFGVNLNF